MKVTIPNIIQNAARLRGVVRQTKNGVRVVVTHTNHGTTVECECQCFGNKNRVHSSALCPLFVANANLTGKQKPEN